MVRTYKKNSKQHWTPQAMAEALAEHKEKTELGLKTSIRELAKKYNIPKSTLGDNIKGDVGVQGRKPVGAFILWHYLYLSFFWKNYVLRNQIS